MRHSLVIPTSAEATQSQRLLESLLPGLERDEIIEIVVVVNGRASKTLDETDLSGVFSHPKIRVVGEPTGSLLAGRHRGVSEARGDVVSFLDDDVTVDETWCDTLVAAFSNNDQLVLAGGPAYPAYDSPPPAWVHELFEDYPEGGTFSPFMSLVDLGPRDIVPVDPNMVWGLNFSIKRSVLEELGGFHPDLLPPSDQMFQGDGETGLTRKISERGLLAGYFSGLAVYHRIPVSRVTSDFLKKRAFYEGVCEEYDFLRHRPVDGPSGFWQGASTSRFGKLKPVIDFFRARVPDVMLGQYSQRLLDKYRLRGREYLRRNFRRHPEVREWVTRENYWDWRHPTLKG